MMKERVVYDTTLNHKRQLKKFYKKGGIVAAYNYGTAMINEHLYRQALHKKQQQDAGALHAEYSKNQENQAVGERTEENSLPDVQDLDTGREGN